MLKKKNKMKEAIKKLALVPVAQAALTSKAQEATKAGVSGATDIFGLALAFINFAIMAIGILGVIVFIYAGFLYLTAAGVEAKMTKAKDTLLWAVVGVAVAVLGLVAVRTIQYYLVQGG